MNAKENMQMKYRGYINQEHLVLTVTLSTYVKTAPAPNYRPETDISISRWGRFWEREFVYRVRRRLPGRAPLDHDYAVELSPGGNWHYHGLLATMKEFEHCLWKDGSLHRRLERDIRSLAFNDGLYRPFRINDFLIEPVKNTEAWCQYITKQNSSLLG